MIYCISDLHGRYDRYEKVLEKIQDTDELYVLGDCIDRGKDGLKILNDIKERNNVHLLMGNHELLLLDALFPLYEGKATLEEVMDTDEYDLWMYNGGYSTISAMEEENCILDTFRYLYNDISLYKVVEVNGEKIYLGHASVLSNYKDFHGTSLSDYLTDKLPYKVVFHSLWDSPFKIGMNIQQYGFDKYVFGHKFVQQFGTDEMIVIEDNIYDIDGGCAIGPEYKNSVILLCLNTMQAEYINADNEDMNVESYRR